ncbi:hypothetical protein [Halobacteriovorax marinus]|uniref:hypothetical protein n=1 Tax=Halobacteriovorax marinus TaxID=97084 RepID=UPI003A950933
MNIFILLFTLLINSPMAAKGKKRANPYTDFINFMSENNFTTGGPLSKMNQECSELREASVQRPVCNTREILGKHQDLFPEDQEYIHFPDGSVLKNVFFSGQSNYSPETKETMKVLDLMKKTSGRAPQTAIDTFERVRSLFIEEITNGTEPDSLSEDQKLLVERISKVQFNINDEFCEGGVWAAFENLTYNINACSAILKLPEHAMIPLLAHELGHSVDFCGMSSKCIGHTHNSKVELTSQEQNTIREQFMRDNPTLSQSRVDSTFSNFQLSLNEFFSSNSRGHELDFLPNSRGGVNIQAFENYLEGLKSKGVVNEIDQGIPVERSPLTSAQKCLEENFHQSPIPSTISEMCADTTFSERGAQIWSAKVTGRYVEQYPPISTSQKLALMEVSMASIKGKNANNWSTKEQDFNTIFLSSPQLRNVFNCTPLPTQSCL